MTCMYTRLSEYISERACRLRCTFVQWNIGSWLRPVSVLACPNKCSSQTRVLFILQQHTTQGFYLDYYFFVFAGLQIWSAIKIRIFRNQNRRNRRFKNRRTTSSHRSGKLHWGSEYRTPEIGTHSKSGLIIIFFYVCGIKWPLFFHHILVCLFIDTTSFTFYTHLFSSVVY